MGAATPIVSYVGITVQIKVPATVIDSETSSAGLRPTLSPYQPSRIAPSGRNRYDSPKVANVTNSETVSSPVGKNSLEMVTAKKP